MASAGRRIGQQQRYQPVPSPGRFLGRPALHLVVAGRGKGGDLVDVDEQRLGQQPEGLGRDDRVVGRPGQPVHDHPRPGPQRGLEHFQAAPLGRLDLPDPVERVGQPLARGVRPGDPVREPGDRGFRAQLQVAGVGRVTEPGVLGHRRADLGHHLLGQVGHQRANLIRDARRNRGPHGPRSVPHVVLPARDVRSRKLLPS